MPSKLIAWTLIGQAPQPRPAPAPAPAAPRPAPAPMPQAGAPRPAPMPQPAAPLPPGTPPPGIAPPKPAPAEAAPPPLAGDVPPEDRPAPPRLNIEGTYPKVTMLKWLGIVWLLAAGVLGMLMNHLVVKDEPVLNLGLGVGLLGAGIGMGFFAFLNEDWRKWMGYFSVFALVGGVAARPIVTPLQTNDIVYVLPGAIFAFTFFMYYEFLDAYQRFTDVARMAVERNLTSFNLNQVINHFLTWGLMLGAVFMVSALMLLTIVTQVIGSGLGQVMANSIEMQTVLGQSMTLLVVFTIVAVVLAFLFLFMDRKTEVQQLAYSREQIRDMVTKGQAPQGPAGPAAPGVPPGGRGGPGVPPGPRGTTLGFVEQR